METINKVVLLSIPYTEMVPSVAPALLSSCLNNENISATAIDLGIEFANEFYDKPYWNELKLFLTVGVIDKNKSYFRPVVDVLKFIKQKLKFIKKKYNPTILGLSIFTTESINFSYLLIPYIRKYLPNVKIMIGGRGLESICRIQNKPHYQKYYDSGLADVIIVGDAETEIIKTIKSNISGIIFAKQQTKEDLDNIPSPDWSNYDMSLYKRLQDIEIAIDETRRFYDPRSMVITASKGCVRNCSFCDVAEYWPKYIFRKGENVAKDIIETYYKTGITNFEFSDNLINGSIPNYRKMNEILVEKIPGKIRYGGFAIFRDKQSMPAEDFELAGRAGCYRWSVGIESGSESVRKNIRKNYTNDDLDYGVYHLQKNRILQHWLFMVGYPSETEKDFLETLELLKKYKHLGQSRKVKLYLTLPFQLNDVAPLLKEEKFIEEFKWDKEKQKQASFRYFWTTSVNPENTFKARYHRFHRFVSLALELDYKFYWTMDLNKDFGELEDLKKIYDQNNKKVIYFS